MATKQEQATALVYEYYVAMHDQHGITMPEVGTLFAMYTGFASAVTMGLAKMAGLASILNNTGGTGFREFVDLFMKVRKLYGVADDSEVDTLLMNAAVAMMTQAR